MTVSSTTNRKTYTGDNATTSFSTSPVVFFDTSDLVVYVVVTATGVSETLVENTDYTVSGGAGAVGTVNLAGGSSPYGAPLSTQKVVIVREVPATQETDFANNDTSDAEVVEDALDRLTMLAQQNDTKLERSLRQPDDDPVDIAALPDKVARASKYLAFDSSGDPTAVDAATASGTTVTATGTLTARSLAERFSDVLNVLDFGAVGDGVTNDTAAIQAAITAADGASVALFFPPGVYSVPSGGLTCSGALRMFGAGRYATNIVMTSTTADLFVLTSAQQCAIEALTLTGPALSTAGALVKLTAGASAENTFSIFRDVTFAAGFKGIETVKAAQVAIENCYFSEYLGRAVTIENQNDVDSGDSHISGCIFSTSGATAEAIRQVSSGGLRIVDNKILGGAYGYRMLLASAAATSICIIEGNSFELQTTASINAVSSGGGATFSQFMVEGNQFSQVPIAIKLDHTSAFMERVLVNDNVISLNASATYGILLAYIDKFVIAGNTICGSGGTPTGIAVDSNSSNGVIGVNHYNALTTNVSNASVSVANPPPVQLRSDGSVISVSATTSEEAMATITIPAKQLGAQGVIKVRAVFEVTNGADDKTIRIRYSGIGGTAVFSYVATTVGTIAIDFVMHNRGATNSQVASAIVTVGAAAVVAPAIVTAAIDTTAVTTLVITGQKETSGDTLTMSHYSVEMLPSRV